MNPESFTLAVWLGQEAVTSALLRNDTPLPQPGDAFAYTDRDGNNVVRKVISRTFLLTRADQKPHITVNLLLGDNVV